MRHCHIAGDVNEFHICTQRYVSKLLRVFSFLYVLCLFVDAVIMMVVAVIRVWHSCVASLCVVFCLSAVLCVFISCLLIARSRWHLMLWSSASCLQVVKV